MDWAKMGTCVKDAVAKVLRMRRGSRSLLKEPPSFTRGAVYEGDLGELLNLVDAPENKDLIGDVCSGLREGRIVTKIEGDEIELGFK